MSIIQGIFKYLFILIGIVFAVGVITIGVMYFFPNVNLFGYHFYKGVPYTLNISAYGDSVDTSGDHIIKVNEDVAKNFDELVLKSNGFNISVSTYKTASEDAPLFQYRFSANMKGLKVLNDPIPSVEISTEIKNLKKVLTFEIKEPNGIFIRHDTNLDLEFPEKSAVFEKLKIETNSGNIVFGADEKANYWYNINDVDVKSGNGKILLRRTHIKSNLNVEKHFGDFILQNDISSNITMNCDDGRYYFQDVVAPEDGRDNNSIQIANKNGSVNFKSIYGNVGVNMDFGLFKCGEIDGQLSVLQHPTTKNNNCDIEIQKVTKQVLINNDSGSIKINETSKIEDNSVSSKLEITSNSSDIDIKNCYSKDVKINSGKGNVLLGNCLGSMDIKTTYGLVQLDYLKSSDTIKGVDNATIQNAVTKLNTRIIKIETGFNNKGDGAIEVYNIASSSQLKSNGSGNIKATFEKVANENSVVANRGACDIVVPNQEYLLKWQGNKNADISVFTIKTQNLDSLSYEPTQNIKLDDGWLKVYNALNSESDKLQVLSKYSSVKIIDNSRI